MKITSKAPGNLFFLGEHAVVYNEPCVITSVGRYTTVTAEEKTGNRVTIESEAFGKASADIKAGKLENKMLEADEMGITLEIAEYLVDLLGINSGFSLHIASDIPVKSGMSSSTALLSAILSATSELFGSPVDANDHYDKLYPFQVKLHGGKASGAEIISSAIGGFNEFQKAKNGITWSPIAELPCKVVIADTRVSVPTSMTVGYHVPSLIDRDKERVMTTFKKIGDLSRKSDKAIKSGDIAEIGRLMNEDQKLLASLGLSHPKLDDCITEALGAGALGAKLSGKGWGGTCFALCTDETQDAVSKAMAKTRADIIVTEIGVKGVRTE